MGRHFPLGDWSWDLVVPPESEPVSLDEAKDALNIDRSLTDFDNYLNQIIPACRAFLENAYDVKIMPQTWQMTLQQFPRVDTIRIPYGPVQNVLLFTYEDTGGNVFELSTGPSGPSDPAFALLTRLKRKPAEIVLPFGKVWPPTVLQMADAIKIKLLMGYTRGDDPETLPMPPQVTMSMYLLLGHFFNNRSAVSLGTLNITKAVDLGVDALMSTLGFKGYN